MHDYPKISDFKSSETCDLILDIAIIMLNICSGNTLKLQLLRRHSLRMTEVLGTDKGSFEFFDQSLWLFAELKIRRKAFHPVISFSEYSPDDTFLTMQLIAHYNFQP